MRKKLCLLFELSDLWDYLQFWQFCRVVNLTLLVIKAMLFERLKIYNLRCVCYRRWMWSRAPLRRHVRWSETSGNGIAAKHIRSSRGAAALKLRYAKPAARTFFCSPGVSGNQVSNTSCYDLLMKILRAVNRFWIYGYWVYDGASICTSTRQRVRGQSSSSIL